MNLFVDEGDRVEVSSADHGEGEGLRRVGPHEVGRDGRRGTKLEWPARNGLKWQISRDMCTAIEFPLHLALDGLHGHGNGHVERREVGLHKEDVSAFVRGERLQGVACVEEGKRVRRLAARFRL